MLFVIVVCYYISSKFNRSIFRRSAGQGKIIVINKIVRTIKNLARRILRKAQLPVVLASDAMQDTAHYYAEYGRYENLAAFLPNRISRVIYRVQYMRFVLTTRRNMYRTMAKIQLRRLGKFTRRVIVWVIIIIICL